MLINILLKMWKSMYWMRCDYCKKLMKHPTVQAYISGNPPYDVFYCEQCAIDLGFYKEVTLANKLYEESLKECFSI